MMNPVEQNTVRITSLGNAGILVRTPSISLAVDPYFPEERSGVDVSTGILESAKTIDWFLITHDHWDHFDPEMVSVFAARYGSRIAAPGQVAERLLAVNRQLKVFTMEPPAESIDGWAPSVSLRLADGFPAVPVPQAEATAYRTPHGRNHVSYLINLPEGRFYFDSDNHDTGVLPLDRLRPVDFLFLYPWHKTGWRGFLERLNPSAWFLVHLSEKELADYGKGKRLSCFGGPLPRKPVVLQPGETWSPGSEA